MVDTKRLNFRRCLSRISSDLSRHDLEELKFACRDVVPVSRMEKIHTGIDLFAALEERDYLRMDKLDFLVGCLSNINRHKLLDYLYSGGFHVPAPPVREGLGRKELFTQCLQHLSQQLQAYEVEKLAYVLAGSLLETNKANIYSAYNLFTLMQQQQLITPDNLDQLYTELSEIGRKDLCKVIEEYYASTGQPMMVQHYRVSEQAGKAPHGYHSGFSSYSPFTTYPPSYVRPNDLPFASQSPTSIGYTSRSSSHPQISFSDTSPPTSGHSQSFYGPAEQASYLHTHTSSSSISSLSSNPEPGSYQNATTLLDSSCTEPRERSTGKSSGAETSPPAVSVYSTGNGFYSTPKRPHEPAKGIPQLSFEPDDTFDLQSNVTAIQKRNELLSQKEQEIRSLWKQLEEEQYLRQKQTKETSQLNEFHQGMIQQLKDALQQKNLEVNELQQELGVLRDYESGEDFYAMEKAPHGICVIFNNYNFYSLDPDHEPLTDRGGAKVDQQNLITTFEYLRYHVRAYENLTSSQMFDKMKEISNMDHSQYDSFICCILTHGEEGRVFGADGQPVDLRDFTGMMKGNFCRALINKPKIFFIQACRGEDEDKGIYIPPERDVQRDGNNPSLPVEADFMFGYATPPGNAAYRSRRHGSWFISELCRVFTQCSQTLGLGPMMKKVNSRVSEAYTKEGHKQCTEVVDRLRKEVHFFQPNHN